VIVATYRARAGEEDTIIALHEDWYHGQKNPDTRGYHSWKLLRKAGTLGEFISIAQFANEELARVALLELEKDEWYGRLVSLMEEEPIRTSYTVVWRLH
jgi:hypothetical protein